MTLNNIIQLFQNIVTAHYNLRGFGFGNIFEINGSLKPGLNYPLLWLVPLDVTTTDQTKQSRFLVLVLDLVKKDQTNRDEVWSDTQEVILDVIKILRNESDDYNLVGDPITFPVAEQHGDWLNGWQSELTIETNLNSNYCDVPKNEID